MHSSVNLILKENICVERVLCWLLNLFVKVHQNFHRILWGMHVLVVNSIWWNLETRLSVYFQHIFNVSMISCVSCFKCKFSLIYELRNNFHVNELNGIVDPFQEFKPSSCRSVIYRLIVTDGIFYESQFCRLLFFYPVGSTMYCWNSILTGLFIPINNQFS